MSEETNLFGCKNKGENSSLISCDILIGHSYTASVPAIFLACAIIGLILNIALFINFYRKKNNNNSRKQSSMKKLFAVLPVLDGLTCIYWIISCSLFYKAERIREHDIICESISLLYLTVFTFEFIFINFLLIHFRKISLNPIEGILKPEKNIITYFLISIIFTLITLALSLFKNIIGRSPMITCFINTEQSEKNGLIFVIHQITILSVIVQIIYDLCCREMFVTDKDVRQAYKTNIIYILVFSLLHLPMLILISITAGKDNLIREEDYVLRGYSFFCTVLTCSIPMIVGIIRNCVGFTRNKKVINLKRRLTRTTKSILGFNADQNNALFNDNDTKLVDQFDWLEKHAMEFFMRDILLAIAHCINNSKQYTENGEKIKLNLQNKENKETLKHHITLKDFPLKDKEEEVLKSNYLNIKITEYAPKMFAFLRNFENINLDEMVESFLPKNNKQGISESQGKSGSFFISTDDNYYMVKTLRSDEFELIRHTFLNKYVQYITHHPQSLLCRIYGMYKITLNQGDEMLVIVMRNVIGDFKDNIIAKYDLKGSTANRKSNFDMEKSDSSVMKDLNFNEYEHGIMISRDHIKHFRKYTKEDSTFLCSLELMDYSVFLVKLTLSKEEEIDLFGEEIRSKKTNAFNELMVTNTLTEGSVFTEEPKLNYDSDEATLKINDVEIRETVRGNGKIYNTKHYHQYLFPSLNPGIAYILSIIDYFQMFNFYKVVESGIKTKFSKNAEGVSCVDPKTYSKRFIKYFEKLTDIKQLFKDTTNANNNENSYSKDDDESEKDDSMKDDSGTTSEGSNIELQIIK